MIIDWLTVTVGGNPDSDYQFEVWCRNNGLDALYDAEACGELRAWRPFNRAMGNSFFRLSWQDGATWSSLSINGHGCEIDRGLVDLLVELNPDNVTRIDIAVDMVPGSLNPLEHASEITARTKSVMESDTGETLYIGSRSSDSFVRIYRYKEPHERANVPRIEAEFKKTYCAVVADAWSNGRRDELASWIARKCNLTERQIEIFGQAVTKPLVMSSERKAGQDGWQRWLHKAAIPAVRKAIQAGLITVDDILIGG